MSVSEHMGRRRDITAAPPRHRPLVAAARKVNLSDKAAIKREAKEQDWHPRAWKAAEVGELKYAINYFANLISKLRIFAAVQIGDEHDATYVPINALLDARADRASADEQLLDIVDHLEQLGFNWEAGATAVEEVRRFRSVYGGQSELLRRMAGNIEVTGACWIVGMEVDDGDGGHVETWEVLSLRQVKTKREDSQGRLWWYRTRDDKDGTPIESGTAWKVWLPALDYHMEPDALIRGVLDDAEALALLTSQIKAEARAAHTSGLLLMPNELSSGTPDPTAGDEGGSEDPFLDDLEDAVLDAVIDPDSGATVFPPVVRGPADVLKEVRVIDLARKASEYLDARIEKRVERCARGLNMPVEVILGHQNTTYANADQVDEDTYTKHVDPRAVLIAQALTYGYLHPVLKLNFDAAEYAGETAIVVWYDPTALVRKADPEESADKLHEAMVISDKAYRTVKGFSEDDAPDEAELLRRLLLQNRGQMDVAVLEGLLKAVFPGEPVEIDRPDPPAIGPGDSQPADGAPADGEDPVAASAITLHTGGVIDPDRLGELVAAAISQRLRPEPIALPAASHDDEVPDDDDGYTPAMVAAAKGVPLGRVLLELDRELRAALWALCESTTSSAIERAAARARGANRETKAIAASLGRLDARATLTALRQALTAANVTAEDLIPDDAFDNIEPQFKAWVSEAGESALNYVEEATSGFTPAERESYKFRHLTDRDEAWQWMKGALLANARGNAVTDAEVIENMAAIEGEFSGGYVPPGLVRAALAQAGGNRVETDGKTTFVAAGGKPPAGVATGPTTLEAAHAQGAKMEAYRWDYGGAPRQTPFAPHKALHGRMFTSFDDPALAKFPGQTFPPFDHYFPGDHKGCICDAEPIMATPRQILTSQGVSRRQQDKRLLGYEPGKKPGTKTPVVAEPEEPPAPLGQLPASYKGPDNAWVQQSIGKSRTSKRPDMRARGYSTAFDGPDVEGFDLHQRGIKLQAKDFTGGQVVDATELKFKLTDSAADRLRKKALAADSEWKAQSPRLPVETNGTVDLNAKGWHTAKTADHNRRTLVHTDPMTGRKVLVEWHDVRPSAESPYAIRNQVRMYVQGGDPVDDGLLQRIMRDTGMTEHSRYPTAEEVRRLAENKLIDTFSTKRAAALTTAQRETELAKIAKTRGVSIDDVQLAHGDNRHVALQLSPQATARVVKDAKVDAFTHHLSRSDNDTLIAMLKSPQGGLSSTMKRWSEGVGGSGLSSSTDMTTGGADYLFTRPQTYPGGFNPEKAASGTVYIAPERLQQLDWHAYTGDSYGVTNPHATRYGDYQANDSFAGLKGRNGGQETMFRNGVAWSDMVAMGVDPRQYDDLMRRLAAEGIDVIPGTDTPVGEFFIRAAY